MVEGSTFQIFAKAFLFWLPFFINALNLSEKQERVFVGWYTGFSVLSKRKSTEQFIKSATFKTYSVEGVFVPSNQRAIQRSKQPIFLENSVTVIWWMFKYDLIESIKCSIIISNFIYPKIFSKLYRLTGQYLFKKLTAFAKGFAFAVDSFLKIINFSWRLK